MMMNLSNIELQAMDEMNRSTGEEWDNVFDTDVYVNPEAKGLAAFHIANNRFELTLDGHNLTNPVVAPVDSPPDTLTPDDVDALLDRVTTIKVELFPGDADINPHYEAWFEDEPEIRGEGKFAWEAVADLYEEHGYFYGNYDMTLGDE